MVNFILGQHKMTIKFFKPYIKNICINGKGFWQKKELYYPVSLLGIILFSLVFFSFAAPEVYSQPLQANSGKECAICHYRWMYQFFAQHKGTSIAPMQEEKVVGSRRMCLSCHDGSVMDSRDKVCNDPGHRIGKVPSKNVSIPETFPLDENGGLMCSTCHTPHAETAQDDLHEEFFLRTVNEDSSLCKVCHVKMFGNNTGNHPINIPYQHGRRINRDAQGPKSTISEVILREKALEPLAHQAISWR